MREHRANYEDTVGTWREQRRWGFDVPLEALGDHELRVKIEEGMNALNVEAEELDLSEFAEVAARDLELGEFVVSVDPATGGLERLWSLRQQREWCDAAHEVGRLQYDVYNSTDYERFFHEYFIVWNEWGPQDFGKPNLDKVHHERVSVGAARRREA